MKSLMKFAAGASLAVVALSQATSSQAQPGCPDGFVWNARWARCVQVGVRLDQFGNPAPEKAFQPNNGGKLTADKARPIDGRKLVPEK